MGDETYNARTFIEAVLSGERHFIGIVMRNAKLVDQPQYKEFNRRLMKRKLALDLSCSVLTGFMAPGIYLGGADLEGVDISNAQLSNADLHGANFIDAKFYGTNLSHANISHAERIERAKGFSRAILYETKADEKTRKIVEEIIKNELTESANYRWSE